MKKFAKATAMLVMLTTLVFSTGQGVYAENADTLKQVQKDLTDTSAYLMNSEAKSLEQEDYAITYDDYRKTMLALKSGEKADKVVKTLNEYLKESLEHYDGDKFLNPYTSDGVESYALAIAALYLNEQGIDASDYHGVNVNAKLKEVFVKETDINPYAYQYIQAALIQSGEDCKAMLGEIEEKVLSLYVSGEQGVGIDCWGWAVSADDNGQVLTVLSSSYTKDAGIKEKVDAALTWNKSQADESGAILSLGAANTDSTALALKAAAQFGNTEDAAFYYQGLQQFKSETTGAYTYAGVDNAYATADAQIALLAYRNALAGKQLFDITREQENPSGDIDDSETKEPEQKETQDNVQKETESKVQEEEVTTTAQTEETEKKEAPKTGDAADVLPYLLAAGFGAAVISSRKRVRE